MESALRAPPADGMILYPAKFALVVGACVANVEGLFHQYQICRLQEDYITDGEIDATKLPRPSNMYDAYIVHYFARRAEDGAYIEAISEYGTVTVTSDINKALRLFGRPEDLLRKVKDLSGDLMFKLVGVDN